MSYEIGHAEALADFGLTKEAYASAALGGLIGAGMGYMADPEKSWQAAAMGGLGGAAVGHGLGNAFRGAPAAAAPSPKKAYKAPAVHSSGDAHAAPAAAAPARAAAPSSHPEAEADIRKMVQAHGLEQRAHRDHVNAVAPVPDVTLEYLRAGAPGIPRTGPQLALDQPGVVHGANGWNPVSKAAADFGLGVGPSGPSLSAFGSPEERLPGMHRWVPRETIEDVYRQLDMGVDPQDVKPPSSPFQDIAGGGVLGGLAGLTLGKSPMKGLIGAGVGAAAGLGKHLLGSKRRHADTQEALYGVTREREAEQAGRQPKQQVQESAREAMPLTVATSVGF